MRLPPIAFRSSVILAAFAALPLTVLAQQSAGAGRQMLPGDLKAWKTVRQTALSNDGKWFAYVAAPNEGDASLTIREIADNGKSYTFNVGSAGAGGRAGGPGGAAGAALAFSGDSKWAAFIIAPPEPARGAGAGGRGGRGGRGATDAGPATPAQDKLGLVNLATGEKREFEKVRRFAFNGDQPTWLAMQSSPPAPEASAARGAGALPSSPAERSLGTDLVLYKLGSADLINIGNVGEFGFDESGTWLAYTIDARDQIGNGVQLRNMKTDVVRVADNDQALYRHLVWADSQPVLAVLRGRPDSVSRDTTFTLVTVQGLDGATFNKRVLDPSKHSEFPGGMKIVADRAPRFSPDLATVFVGIRPRNKPPMSARTFATDNGRELIQAGAPGNGGTVNQPRTGPDNAETLPSLILWNSLDSRLQSQQIVQEAQDRSFNYLAEYRAPDDKFVVLADSAMRNVSTTGRDQFAFGSDTRAYDWAASFNGRRFEDLYSVDLKSGARKELLKKHLAEGAQMPSPDGRSLLYWGDDANWWVADLGTGEEHAVTKTSGVSFVNTEDDHNNLVPPPHAPLGWSKDGSAVLLTDGWDIYKVAIKTGQATNLTVNGKRDQIRYQRIYNFERSGAGGGGRAGGAGGFGGGGRTDGIDLSKPLYVATYGEWTKKSGLSRIDPDKAGATPLVWEDAAISFQRARDADVYLYTRQTNVDFPDYYVANPGFKGGRRLTDVNPQQKDFAWSSGVKLIDYTSDKGDKLQGALYLPANYEPGKKYPLLVTIYEKRSDLAHTYVTPNETSTPNRSIYTSRGYAVLDPDIVYRVNDPGMSAVWCVIPAVKAAIATGMIDDKNIGLWGHSWGGYQTAFLVTQTDIFKTAIAGAPLTDMVSMYSSIYWNTGGANQAIFESSQGRFKGNFLENEEAYIRNSPVFHANTVKTPLIILSDDKDGAVDFNQGITYFNTLRQLGKKVILFEYVGENHGLARPVNQKDYAVRQREWFDYYLKGATPPDWITKGIPRLEMDDHLRERSTANQVTPIP